MNSGSLWQDGFRLTKVFGIEIRIHMLFVLWVAFDLLRASGYEYEGAVADSAFNSAVLFSIVLLHEFGHCYAGRMVGGTAERILMWPLGGLAYVAAPWRPRPQMIVTAGGPLVNVAIALLLAPYIIFGDGVFGSYMLRIMDDPATFYSDRLSIAYSINFDLLCFNLIPAFPMDGGQLLRSALWPRFGFKKATIYTIYVARVILSLMLVAGLYTFFNYGGLLLPVIAVWLLFSAEREKKMVEQGAYEGRGDSYEQSFTVPGYSAPVEKRSWLQRQRDQRESRRRERDSRKHIELERRLDHLLDKVKQEGITSLTAKEKRFLTDASRRYRK